MTSQTSKITYLRRLVVIMTSVVGVAVLLLTYLQVEWDRREALAKEKSLGLGKVAQPLRVAVTGGTVSPPIDQTLALLGRERTLARLARIL